MKQKKTTQKKPVLKTCPIDPRHIWIADIKECPYCTKTREERVAWVIKNG